MFGTTIIYDEFVDIKVQPTGMVFCLRNNVSKEILTFFKCAWNLQLGVHSTELPN
jgi:hypothetical protein